MKQQITEMAMTNRERIPDEPKTASVLVKCSPDWRERVQAAAKSAGMSVGQYMRQAAEYKISQEAGQ